MDIRSMVEDQRRHCRRPMNRGIRNRGRTSLHVSRRSFREGKQGARRNPTISLDNDVLVGAFNLHDHDRLAWKKALRGNALHQVRQVRVAHQVREFGNTHLSTAAAHRRSAGCRCRESTSREPRCQTSHEAEGQAPSLHTPRSMGSRLLLPNHGAPLVREQVRIVSKRTNEVRAGSPSTTCAQGAVPRAGLSRRSLSHTCNKSRAVRFGLPASRTNEPRVSALPGALHLDDRCSDPGEGERGHIVFPPPAIAPARQPPMRASPARGTARR